MLSYTALGNIKFSYYGLNVYMPYEKPIYIIYSNVSQNFKQIFFAITLIVLKVSIDSIGFNQNHPLASLHCFTISSLQQCNSLQALTFHVYLNVDVDFVNVFQ